MGWVQLDVMPPQKQLQETFNAYGEVEVLPRYNIPPHSPVSRPRIAS